MKTFKFKNATVYISGNISKERLENATIQFMKKAQKYKIVKRKADA